MYFPVLKDRNRACGKRSFCGNILQTRHNLPLKGYINKGK